MIVSDLKTYIVNCFRTNWVFVKVETDEGITGFAEATLEYREKTVVEAIEEIRKYLIGKDPFDTELHHLHMERDTYWRYGPILSTALSAIDIALWDIKGKVLNVPIYQLLGGKVRDRMEVYVNSWFTGARTKEEFAEKAKQTVANGFTALKWDPFGSAYLNMSAKEINNTMEIIGAVREAVGPCVDLLIEGHGRFNVPTAIRIGRELEPYKVYWFEEPLHPGRIDKLAEVRRSVPVPIAAGERTYSRFECAELLAKQAVDYLQSDVCHVGGITELKKIAAIADANYITLSPHNPMGPICNAATLHVVATCTNFQYLETMITDVPWRKEIVCESAKFEDGGFILSDKPGLGIELNEEVFGKYPYEIHELRHYVGTLTDIRPKDEKQWF